MRISNYRHVLQTSKFITDTMYYATYALQTNHFSNIYEEEGEKIEYYPLTFIKSKKIHVDLNIQYRKIHDSENKIKIWSKGNPRLRDKYVEKHKQAMKMFFTILVKNYDYKKAKEVFTKERLYQLNYYSLFQKLDSINI